MHFMKVINHLFSKLDELVLSHKNVYKIENVANCYMVSCNAPYVSVSGSNTPFRIYAILSVMVCAYEFMDCSNRLITRKIYWTFAFRLWKLTKQTSSVFAILKTRRL